MAMMRARNIRDLRGRWESEARQAAADGCDRLYWSRIHGIAALDLVLGDRNEFAHNRIPYQPSGEAAPQPSIVQKKEKEIE